jgi:hypothetical protein
VNHPKIANKKRRGWTRQTGNSLVCSPDQISFLFLLGLAQRGGAEYGQANLR